MQFIFAVLQKSQMYQKRVTIFRYFTIISSLAHASGYSILFHWSGYYKILHSSLWQFNICDCSIRTKKTNCIVLLVASVGSYARYFFCSKNNNRLYKANAATSLAFQLIVITMKKDIVIEPGTEFLFISPVIKLAISHGRDLLNALSN